VKGCGLEGRLLELLVSSQNGGIAERVLRWLVHGEEDGSSGPKVDVAFCQDHYAV